MALLSNFVGGSGGGTQKHQKFTSSGTWTHPDPGNVIHLYYQAAGGGAGGENEQAENSNSSGGGGAEINSGLMAVTGDVAVSLGSGGTGGATGTNFDGAVGGDTEIEGAPVALGGGRYYEGSSIGIQESSFVRGGGTYAVSANDSIVMRYGQGSTGGGGGSGSKDGTGTQYALGGAGNFPDGASAAAGGGGASLGKGGDGGDGIKGGTGVDGGGGGAAINNGGGGDGGDGAVELFWVE